ncbi:MAG: hypothetical protein IT446_08220 [Phycisphaerales bacterium]|jgi:hypothetical protein|nr:hypothetical protein [Phycisphaerales bacterium]
MSKKVLLIGHCGPDSSYLRMVVRAADPKAQILMADDPDELTTALEQGVDLALLNRELGYGFGERGGVEVIGDLKESHPQLRLMLVSNYPEAQQAAEQAGALPGFGKREIGSPRVVQLLKAALEA